MHEPKRKLLAILAHPDDESLGMGGMLARYAAEGIETYVITATRGEKGWQGSPETNPGPEALGSIREKELYAAARTLGVRDVLLLDYVDGELNKAEASEVIGQLVTHIRRIKPQVVVTFDPYGLYGHPDHIAISQFATAAVLAAADLNYPGPLTGPIHRADKLYYLVLNAEDWSSYQEVFGDLVMNVDGEVRRSVSWPDWAITAKVDSLEYWLVALDAVSQHRSQLADRDGLLDLRPEQQRHLWGTQRFYRALSINGGRKQETSLFEGVEPEPEPLVDPVLDPLRNLSFI